MEKIGIFFGPTLGNVAKTAAVIANELGTSNVELISVKTAKASDISRFSKIILGLSTIGRANWDSKHIDTDWDLFMTHLEECDWTNKTVAIFGLGDQITYSDNFVDAIGWVYERLEKLNVKIIGATSTDGYQFTESEAVRNNQLMGLAIDEDNEPELTLPRVKAWIENLKKSGF